MKSNSMGVKSARAINSVGKIVDRMIDRIVPKGIARAGSLHCYGSNPICYGYGSGLCATGAYDSAGTGYKWCYYYEYVVYPYGSCNLTCYNGCDCYKKVANATPCPSSASGCTW